jgi:hypothetical protein
MAWKHVDAIYMGGSEELKALRGAVVRTRGAILQQPNHKGDEMPDGDPVDLSPSHFGRVASPYKDMVLIAFLPRPLEVPPPLDQLWRTDSFVARLNWMTFRWQFDIEMP